MADNNFKLLGHGLRGTSLVRGHIELPESQDSMNQEPQTAHIREETTRISRGVIVSAGSTEMSIPAVKVPVHFTTIEPYEAETILDEDGTDTGSQVSRKCAFTDRVFRYFATPITVPNRPVAVTQREGKTALPENNLVVAAEQDATGKKYQKVTMKEELPPHEAQRDRIVADMLTWSSCHQRQKAGEIVTGGHFTFAYTKAIQEMQRDKPKSVGELYEIVNQKVIDQMIKDNEEHKQRKENQKKKNEAEQALKGRQNEHKDHSKLQPGTKGSAHTRTSTGNVISFLQYVQLWTSLGNESEDAARDKLKREFII